MRRVVVVDHQHSGLPSLHLPLSFGVNLIVDSGITLEPRAGYEDELLIDWVPQVPSLVVCIRHWTQQGGSTSSDRVAVRNEHTDRADRLLTSSTLVANDPQGQDRSANRRLLSESGRRNARDQDVRLRCDGRRCSGYRAIPRDPLTHTPAGSEGASVTSRHQSNPPYSSHMSSR